MHELSIAEELVAVREELRGYPNMRLKSALVRVGVLRLIEPSTLARCFEAATWDSPLRRTTACRTVQRVGAMSEM